MKVYVLLEQDFDYADVLGVYKEIKDAQAAMLIAGKSDYFDTPNLTGLDILEMELQ